MLMANLFKIFFLVLGHGNGGVVPGAALQQTKFTAAATALQTDTNTLSSSSGAHPTDHQQQAIIQHIVSQQQQQTGQPSAAHASVCNNCISYI